MSWRHKNNQHLRSSYSSWACGMDWIQGFPMHKILRKKENEFMNIQLGFRLQFASVWAKGKLYYSNIFILQGQECILASPSSGTHAAGSQLYPRSPTLEGKARAGLHPSPCYCSTQKLCFCLTGRETNASQTSPAFAIVKHLSYPWHKAFWHF